MGLDGKDGDQQSSSGGGVRIWVGLQVAPSQVHFRQKPQDQFLGPSCASVPLESDSYCDSDDKT